jgi:signal transduction histidine kinase
MRERIEHLEGEMHITSTPGNGTEIRLAVPLRAYDKDVA